MPGNTTSLCIVAPGAYGALSGDPGEQGGGVERQTSLIARWFASRGYRVSVITWAEGQAADTVIDGVRAIRLCRRDAGIFGLRFFHPRWTSLNRVLLEADADIYYQGGAEYVTGQVALWCRRHRRRFVHWVASDMDCDPLLPHMRTRRERVLYRYGLREADLVLAMTRTQARMLLDGFRRPSEVISMPCEGPSEDEYRYPPRRETRSRVLWFARVCQEKRPDRLLELAEQMPDVHFDLAGPISDPELQPVVDQARNVPNIEVLGRVPRKHLPELYRRADCLCCTSDIEGFPNTFLEAWSHGLPIASMFDPDDVIRRHALGVVAADVTGLARGLRGLLASETDWQAASRSARRYYTENHAAERVLPRIESTLLSVASSRSG